LSEEEISEKAATIFREQNPDKFTSTFCFHGARKLGDGRVVLKACTEADAGKIRELGPDWVSTLADGMQVSKPSHQIIVHGVPANFAPGLPATTSLLHHWNKLFITLPTDITHARWLHGLSDRHIPKSASSLVITLSREDAAVSLVDHGTSVLGKLCRTDHFIQSPPQCYHCQGWNHISSVCPQRNEPSRLACARCAGNHNTKSCSCPHSPQCSDLRSCPHIAVKCANCQGPHKSFDNSCTVKQQCLAAHRALHSDPCVPVRAGGRAL
ncbi:hypothetical protein R3P38DRAFT_2371248, partial [Favolaschia claudopus]